MNPQFYFSLVLVLSGTLYCHLAAAQGPGKTAPPAAKDAYVAAQLVKLFAGAPAHVALRGAFYNWLDVDVSASPDNGMPTNRLATIPDVRLFAFDNDAAARDQVRSELPSFKSPTALTRAGYDEFYAGNEGRMIGRRGADVVLLRSIRSKRFDAVLDAIATNLAAHPELLSNLVHYARTMHFGDPAALHVVLSRLNDKFPELSAARFDTNSPFYAENAVVADYTASSDNELTIVAKAYDSAAAAKAGQARDQGLIQAGGWNRKSILRHVQVYESTDCGTMYFHTGHYTFKLMASRYRRNEVPPLLLRVGSALITTFAPPPGKP